MPALLVGVMPTGASRGRYCTRRSPRRSTLRALFDMTTAAVARSGAEAAKARKPQVPPLCQRTRRFDGVVRTIQQSPTRSASSSSVATAQSRYHLRSAGTTFHGEASVKADTLRNQQACLCGVDVRDVSMEGDRFRLARLLIDHDELILDPDNDMSRRVVQ